MQRELLGVLYQMSKTEGGCARIEGIELGGALQRALRSPHPSVVRGYISYRRFWNMSRVECSVQFSFIDRVDNWNVLMHDTNVNHGTPDLRVRAIIQLGNSFFPFLLHSSMGRIALARYRRSWKLTNSNKCLQVTYAAGVMKNLERGGASQRRFNE